MNLLNLSTRYLFFTGKGGVGKTALSCATALALADRGKRVLLISTDPASNLEEMLGARFGDGPTPVSGAATLWAMNVDPEAAAEAYRRRVIEPYIGLVSESEVAKIREELSGACTVEIAAFDEFARLLDDQGAASEFDHVIFDTAPTGHTIRLLSLPKAWSSFLEHNDRGAACLGPHSGLTMQQARFEAARNTLADPLSTTVVLVARPDASALYEAARSSAELGELGLGNQRLIVNGVFQATDREDAIALALERRTEAALASMPTALARLPRDTVPLRPFNMVGLPALRALLAPRGRAELPPGGLPAPETPLDLQPLGRLLAELETPGHGLIMTMGKGGVGKTTVAAALAVALARRGHRVHLSTTDPAAHVAGTVAGDVSGLTVSRIDPAAETAAYTAKVMAARGRDLNAAGRALLEEDLKSPCTEEVAVFHAFSRIVSEARRSFVVLDTAPTGHSLLLMDATGAYHRQVLRDSSDGAGGRMVTPLMRLQNPDYSRIILVTLAETTPVSEAAALQQDLRRARIEPFAWVINQSLAATGTRDPVLTRRAAAEREQIERVRHDLAGRLAIVPWMSAEPIGPAALEALVAPSGAAGSEVAA